jgi:endonuclease YncB( thermonuclease family)
LWVVSDPVLVDPPAFLQGEPEQVTGTFTQCGKGSNANCVVDGDTIRIGKRSIRLIGIDAPEVREPRCPAEAELGAKATQELLRLTNAGPFTMTSRLDEPRDRYGRELRVLTRAREDGTTQSFARDLIASGTVRRYTGGSRGDWCAGSAG